MLNFFFFININCISNNFNLINKIFLYKSVSKFYFNSFRLLNIKFNLKNISTKKYCINALYKNNFIRLLSFLYINCINTQLFVSNFNGVCNKILANFNYINIIYYIYYFKNINILYNYFFFLSIKKKIIIGVGIDPYIIKYIVKLNLIFIDLCWFYQTNFIIFYLVNYFFFFKRNFIFLKKIIFVFK